MKTSTVLILVMLFLAIVSAVVLALYQYISSKENEVSQAKSEERIIKNQEEALESTKVLHENSDSLIKELGRKQVSSKREILKAIENSKEQEVVSDKLPFIRLSEKGIYLIEDSDNESYDHSRRYYRAHFAKNEAVASNLNIDTWLIFEYSVDGEKKFEVIKHEFFEHFDELPVGSADAPLGSSSKSLNDERFYVYFKGTYTNYSGSKVLEIDKLYEFDHETQKTSEKIGLEKLRLLKLFGINS